ncbi:MAG: DUF5658 family protein [Gammaproteobacteria bacterium]|nr:DUF5658 family protein [Gammaproteobacteria bacterium]
MQLHNDGGSSDLWSTVTDRRSEIDRRQWSLSAFFYQFVMGRRRGERRREARHPNHYVDMHQPKVLFTTLSILLLCVVDVYFTLTLLEHGGVELNPIMLYLIERSIWWFFVGKYTITACCLVVLVAHNHFRLFKWTTGFDILQAILLAYLVLVAYELLLLSLGPGLHGVVY